MKDRRLGRSVNLFKIMMAVCSYDRMSQVRGGWGCYASRENLIRATQLDPADLSRGLQKLIELGYLERRKFGKCLVYSVPGHLYPPLENENEDQDLDADQTDRGYPPLDEQANLSEWSTNWEHPQPGIGGVPNEAPSGIGDSNRELFENAQESKRQYIARNHRNKNSKRSTQEFAPIVTAAPLQSPKDRADGEDRSGSLMPNPPTSSPPDFAQQYNQEAGNAGASFSETSRALHRAQSRAVSAAFGINYSVPATPDYRLCLAKLNQKLRSERRISWQTSPEESVVIWALLADELESGVR